MSNDSDDSRDLSRRDFVQGTGAAGLLASIPGYTIPNDADTQDFEEFQNQSVPNQVKPQYWNNWPYLPKNAKPNASHTATKGKALPKITAEFSSEDDPWMREHALMIKAGLDRLKVPVSLKDRPLNQIYADWTKKGLGNPISMSTHGPDPQRGLDPNPLLMRRYKENLSNYMKYWNDELNPVLEEQRRTTQNKSKRVKLVKQAQSMLAEDVANIVTLFPDVITAANVEDWTGYVPTPGNGTTRDSFQWTELNLQPQGNSRTFVKGVTSSMNSKNIAWSSGGPEEKRLKFVYDGLFDASPELEVVPALATGMEFVDPKTAEMDLRQGVQWHDGKPFTPEDVKFTVEKFQQYSSPSQAAFYEPIKNVEILSKKGGGRVRFNLKYPDASFSTQRVVRSVIIPKHKWDKIDSPNQYNPENPIGTGPFKFGEWNQGTKLVLNRNDNHWAWDDSYRKKYLGKHFESGKGITKVVWSNLANINALIGALQKGDIDAIGIGLANSQAERAASQPGLEKQVAKNFAPLGVHLDHTVPLLRDKEFRIAFSQVTQKKRFVQSVLGGRAEVQEMNHPISPLLDDWYNGDVKTYPYAPKKARQRLKKAGYTISDGTLKFPSGEAWKAFYQRVKNGHATRQDLNQPNFA